MNVNTPNHKYQDENVMKGYTTTEESLDPLAPFPCAVQRKKRSSDFYSRLKRLFSHNDH